MSEQEKQTKVIQSYEQPIEIDLNRSAKGQYYWKIQVKAESPIAALRMVQDIDSELRHRFSEAPEPNPSFGPAGSTFSQDPHQRIEKALESVKKAGEKGPQLGE